MSCFNELEQERSFPNGLSRKTAGTNMYAVTVGLAIALTRRITKALEVLCAHILHSSRHRGKGG